MPRNLTDLEDRIFDRWVRMGWPDPKGIENVLHPGAARKLP